MPSNGYGVRRLLCHRPSTCKNETQAHERGGAKNGRRTHCLFHPQCVDLTRPPFGTNRGRWFHVCSTIDSSLPLCRRTGINRSIPKSQLPSPPDGSLSICHCCVSSDLSLVRWSASPEMKPGGR